MCLEFAQTDYLSLKEEDKIAYKIVEKKDDKYITPYFKVIFDKQLCAVGPPKFSYLEITHHKMLHIAEIT